MFLYETGRKSLSNTVNIYLLKVNKTPEQSVKSIQNLEAYLKPT